MNSTSNYSSVQRANEKPHLIRIILAARQLTESLTPVLILQHTLKAPLKDSHGSWRTIDDLDEVAA